MPLKSSVFMRLALVASILFCSIGSTAQTPSNLLHNGGFEGGSGSNGAGAGIPFWDAYGTGYEIDRDVHREGDQAIRCTSVSTASSLGAHTGIDLNQVHPLPVLISGWSKAQEVGGGAGPDYSLYVDVLFMDGDHLYGQSATFAPGTHSWQHRRVVVLPQKPIRHLDIYALFRNRTGAAWFDDFSAATMVGAGLFDGQSLPPLPHADDHHVAVRLRGGDGLGLDFGATGDIIGVHAGTNDISSPTGGGFFVRDVAADGSVAPLVGTAAAYEGGVRIMGSNKPLKLDYNLKILPRDGSLWLDGEIEDNSGKERAITVYLALPIEMIGWKWGNDIRSTEIISADREFTNQVHVEAGVNGGLSLYPFGCISNGENGVAIASQMDWPSIFRIFANGPNREFVIAWDCSLPRRPTGWQPGTTRFRASLFRLPAAKASWGFRAASERFYRIMQPRFDKITNLDGIWIPFSDPSRIPTPGDFGFAFHEGDTSVKTDNALGVLALRYTEPMSYWMNMAREVPRTYEAAVAQLKNEAAGTDPKTRDMARAVLNSGTEDIEGKFNVEFQNQPWANGAVWINNVSPELPATPDKPTRASVAYSSSYANARYGEAETAKSGRLDGEYLDSLESWADYLDYRPSSLAVCPYPLPFDADSYRPVIPEWYHVHAFTRFLHDDLHNRGKILMANTSPVRFTIMSAQLDVSGIETNWLDNGVFHPDTDATFNLRRTMSNRKPYLLLMNTDFTKFTHSMVERYFLRSLFYGVFPSMFSVNAADNPYWENPALYNRDRDLFKRYIPLIKELSAAGWEPVTLARSDRSDIWLERWGDHTFTALNSGTSATDAVISLDAKTLGLKATAATDAISGKRLNVTMAGAVCRLSVHLEPEQVMQIEVR